MEGPSIHLLSQELQLFVGQKIIAIGGNAKFDQEPLLNQTIKEIYAFGKKLIIQLDNAALVTHFLMYGSYRIDEQRKEMSARLALKTTNHELFFYNCSTKCLHGHSIKKMFPFEFDILSPLWDIKKVVAAVKKHPTTTIDDILLDQTIFAGVGNIIKNEVLFLTQLPPQKKISHLTDKKIIQIALTARIFSEKFLELRQNFELKKNLSIYRKPICPVCGTKIIRKKTGTHERWSFYCPHCQK